MNSCYQIISLALSKLGVAGATKQPRDIDLKLGLVTLQSMYREMIANGTLGRAQRVVVTQDYTARPRDHIIRKAGNIVLPTVGGGQTFFDDVLDAEWDYGAGATLPECRPLRDGDFVVINDSASGITTELIYDGYVDKWITVHDLTLDDNTEYKDADGVVYDVRTSDAPLSANRNGLSAVLAVQLADHFGSDALSPLTLKQAQAFQQQLASGFGDQSDVLTITPY